MVAIVDYNAGNTRSLQFALDRLGVNSSLTSNIEEIQSAEKIIFQDTKCKWPNGKKPNSTSEK